MNALGESRMNALGESMMIESLVEKERRLRRKHKVTWARLYLPPLAQVGEYMLNPNTPISDPAMDHC